MAENEQTGTPEGIGSEDKGVGIQKVYLKDASFESPESPAVFTGEWDPKMKLDVDTQAREASDGRYEVVLKITIEAQQDGKTAFIVEVQQAGVFAFRGFNDEEVQRIVGSFCPTALFPYAREAVGDLVMKGGFPSVLLQPINFDTVKNKAQPATGG